MTNLFQLNASPQVWHIMASKTTYARDRLESSARRLPLADHRARHDRTGVDHRIYKQPLPVYAPAKDYTQNMVFRMVLRFDYFLAVWHIFKSARMEYTPFVPYSTYQATNFGLKAICAGFHFLLSNRGKRSSTEVEYTPITTGFEETAVREFLRENHV